MPFITVSALPVREIFPGLRARLIHTDRQTHSWVEVEAGAAFPEHHHPHEQIVSVIEGELEVILDGVVHRLTPGSVLVIPPEARHSGHGVTACRVLDVFSPARDDYRGQTPTGRGGPA